MKKVILVFLLITIISGCLNVKKANEENKKDFIVCPGKSGTFCMQVYDPVCGEDNKTYSNSCVACNSVMKYKKGECLIS